jgi:hypothetical protein
MKISEIILELKVLPGQTEDDNYKGWNIRYQLAPKKGSTEFQGKATQPKGTAKDSPVITAASSQELQQKLKAWVDEQRGSNEIPQNSRVTVFFNRGLVRDIIGHGDDIFADFDKSGSKPLLILSTENQGGMFRATDRSSVTAKSREGHVGMQAFAYPSDRARSLGLTYARYRVGEPIEYSPGVMAFELDFQNEVHPGERLQLNYPGVTISPPVTGMKMGEDFDLEEEPAPRSLCLSGKPDSALGASQLSSCKSQGYRSRDGGKSHKVGGERVKVRGKKIKGKKYGGPLPDWS